jgi:hypothetical protein
VSLMDSIKLAKMSGARVPPMTIIGIEPAEVSPGTELSETIRLKLHDNKMMVLVQNKGNIKATFTWEGEWKTTGGKIVKDGARVTLVVDPGTYKLLGIDGKNMFIPSENPTPARQ